MAGESELQYGNSSPSLSRLKEEGISKQTEQFNGEKEQ
jgi:hypothetical protein